MSKRIQQFLDVSQDFWEKISYIIVFVAIFYRICTDNKRI